MSKFQIGLILGAIVLLSIAVMIISGVLPGLRGDEYSGGNILMWGFEDENFFNNPFRCFTIILSSSLVGVVLLKFLSSS